jgi:RNA polymerase sigma-70 factor, ECF subfamily
MMTNNHTIDRTSRNHRVPTLVPTYTPPQRPKRQQTEPESAEAEAASWRTDPDVVLMESVRDGDDDAFQVLFEKYSGAIVKFAYRFLGSRDRAEEVAQTAFLQLFRARKRYLPKARFATFLYRIAANLCLNELRRFDYSGKIESLDTVDDPDSTNGGAAVDRMPDHDSPGPAQRLAYREIATEIKKVLKGLPPNQRMALLLSRVDGFSYQEVADSLETSVSAVKSLIFRATSTLRKDLAEVI